MGGAEFMDARRLGLERFLVQLVGLPLLAEEPAANRLVCAFLEKATATAVDGKEDWAAGVEPVDVLVGRSQETDTAASVLQWWRGAVQDFKNSYTHAGREAAALADPEFVALRSQLSRQQIALTDGTRLLEAELRRRTLSRGAAVALGRGLCCLADSIVQPPGTPGAPGDAAALLGLGQQLAEQLQPQTHEQQGISCSQNLAAVLRRQAEVAEAVTEVAELRAMLLANTQSRRAVAEEKRAEATAATSAGAASAANAATRAEAEAYEVAEAAEAAAMAAGASLEQCRQRMAVELGRLATERTQAYRSACRAYAAAQLAEAERSVDQWRDLVGRMDAGSSAQPERPGLENAMFGGLE
jgi:hypothetical protein